MHQCFLLQSNSYNSILIFFVNIDTDLVVLLIFQGWSIVVKQKIIKLSAVTLCAVLLLSGPDNNENWFHLTAAAF